MKLQKSLVSSFSHHNHCVDFPDNGPHLINNGLQLSVLHSQLLWESKQYLQIKLLNYQIQQKQNFNEI